MSNDFQWHLKDHIISAHAVIPTSNMLEIIYDTSTGTAISNKKSHETRQLSGEYTEYTFDVNVFFFDIQSIYSWRLLTMSVGWRASSVECMYNQESVSADKSVQIKTGTYDPSSSRKGRDSLSPELVEYLGNSLWKDVGLEGLRSRCMYNFFR